MNKLLLSAWVSITLAAELGILLDAKFEAIMRLLGSLGIL